jgi:phenylalanyl-tRNA synthetase beta chain
MRVPLAWLAEFVDLPGDDELCHRLEMSGFEDVLIEQSGPDLGEIRVGSVLTCETHPDADKLHLCSVDIGGDEPSPIVCGAPNIAAGQKVAVAVPGVRLPDGTKLKKAKIRGQVSLGMICSTRELGLGDEHDGILVLDADAPVGAPLPEVMATGDKTIEVGITPNRGDTASLLGLAREVGALFEREVRLPTIAPVESGAAAADAVRVEIEADDACHRYVARIVRGVRVAPSPDWVVARLEASGIRAINNVVDATNLVLLELGQPLHAFDLSTLRGGVVRVRRARSGEKLATLDGVARTLVASDLVIADAERAIALAGVMGGAQTEVGEGSVDLLIESAHFDPSTVRLSARRQGIHSEASYRFERGVDRAGIGRAAERAARLIAELAGGEVAPGAVEAVGSAPRTTESISLDVSRCNKLLGTAIAPDAAAALLARVGVTSEGGGDTLTCRIPTHRNDLHVHQDLTEEVARIYGYENIPTTLPQAELAPVRWLPSRTLCDRARDALAGCGLVETMTVPFVAEADLAALRLPEDDPRSRALPLANPIQEQEGVLRTTLVPSLLRVAHQNQSRQVDRVRLFEIAGVFVPRGDREDPEEPLSAVAMLAGEEPRRLWSAGAPPPLFFEARGVAERLLSALGYMACLRSGGSTPYLHPGASAEVMVGDRRVGWLGELHPEVAAAFEIDTGCALVEVNLSTLLTVKKRESQFREVSREPSVRRDAAFLVDRTQPAGELLEAIRKAAGGDLVTVDLFDRYEGKGVPEGRVSLAFRLVFQRADRTLTDAEVSKSVDRVVRALTKRFGAELR